jgi:hypothetical protein
VTLGIKYRKRAIFLGFLLPLLRHLSMSRKS